MSISGFVFVLFIFLGKLFWTKHFVKTRMRQDKDERMFGIYSKAPPDGYLACHLILCYVNYVIHISATSCFAYLNCILFWLSIYYLYWLCNFTIMLKHWNRFLNYGTATIYCVCYQHLWDWMCRVRKYFVLPTTSKIYIKLQLH